ncbi:MAG: MATE family efflux transporter [Alphaproteobacteria bacterium]
MALNAAGETPGMRRVMALAAPIVVSNVTVPLIGVVDTAVMGHMPDAAYIGAVALGAVVFSFVYWGFGFLRMATTGLTAQAFGRWQAVGDAEAALALRAALARPLALAAALGLALVILQWPIGAVAFAVLNGSETVEALASIYFTIRIWGAPFTLGGYAVLGWLLGQQATRAAVAMQIATNLFNVGLSLLFVLGFGWGVAGVAAGTLVAEAAGLVFGLWLVRRRLWRTTGNAAIAVPRPVLLDRAALRQLAGVNFDIFVRTLCLVFAFCWFTDRSAQMGDRLLAANAILLQFQSFMAYALDGFAFAAEALVGHAIGARRPQALRAGIRAAAGLGFAASAVFAVAYGLFGDLLVALMTDLPQVRAATADYRWWMATLPLVSVGSFLLDGIFIGATKAAEMRNAMLVSVAAFIPAGYLLSAQFGNQGLWAAFALFMLLRAVTLGLYLPRVLRAADRR